MFDLSLYPGDTNRLAPTCSRHHAAIRGLLALWLTYVAACWCLPLVFFYFHPEFRRDYPLNLSISVSGGKENKSDSLSNGE